MIRRGVADLDQHFARGHHALAAAGQPKNAPRDRRAHRHPFRGCRGRIRRGVAQGRPGGLELEARHLDRERRRPLLGHGAAREQLGRVDLLLRDSARLAELLAPRVLVLRAPGLRLRRQRLLLGGLQGVFGRGDPCLRLGVGARVQHGGAQRLELGDHLAPGDAVADVEVETPHEARHGGRDLEPVAHAGAALLLDGHRERCARHPADLDRDGLRPEAPGERCHRHHGEQGEPDGSAGRHGHLFPGLQHRDEVQSAQSVPDQGKR